MIRKRMIWFSGGILWILLLFTGVLVIRRPSLQSVSKLIAMSDNMTFFVVDNTGNRPVIYEADKEGTICGIHRTSGTGGEAGKITQLVWNGDGLSYLKESASQYGKGKISLYQCDSHLEQEELLGEISLEQGERVKSLQEENGKLLLLVLGAENQQVKVLQVRQQEESQELAMEQLAVITAGEQEWFCDAAYREGRTYVLDYMGNVWRCEGNNREIPEEAEGRLAVWLRGTRGGIFCETQTGQTKVLADGALQESECMEHVMAMDALSSKAYVQLGRKLPNDIQINLYEPGKRLEISGIHMTFGLLLRDSGKSLLAVGSIGGLLWLAAVLLAKSFQGPKRTIARTVGTMLFLQTAMGAILVGGVSSGQQKAAQRQQEEMAETLTSEMAEGVKDIDFETMNIKEMIQAGRYDTIRGATRERVYQSGQKQFTITGILARAGNLREEEAAYVTAAAGYASGFSLYETGYGELLETLEGARSSGSAESCVILEKGGQHALVLAAVPIGGRITPRDYLIAQVDVFSVRDSAWLWKSIVWIMADGLLCILLVLYQGKAVERFAKAVEGAVEGRRREPAFGDSGFGPAWVQIQRQIAELEWHQNQEEKKRQAYGRFFPVQFAKLMGHNSLDEVALGEVHRVAGAFLQISVEPAPKAMGVAEGEAYVKYLNWLLEFFGGREQEKKGVILPGGSNPGSIRILYEERAEQALNAAVRACRRLKQETKIQGQQRPAFLIHYGIYTCGLTGTGESVYPFAFAPEIERLKQYTQKLKDIQVDIAVTEQMLPHLNSEHEYRYIGCMPGVRGEEVFRFYEILDAYGEEEKEKRCRTREKFQKALELYEQNDFYLARMKFSDILKECPKDLVAVRYVFACEQMFHAQETENISHYLFELEQE